MIMANDGAKERVEKRRQKSNASPLGDLQQGVCLDADHAYTYLLEAFVQVSRMEILTIMSDMSKKYNCPQ